MSNVEHILNTLKFCVLVDFRIRLEIRPKMNGGFHRRSHKHSIHVFCMLPLRMFELVADISKFLPQTLKDLAYVLLVRVFHVFQFW